MSTLSFLKNQPTKIVCVGLNYKDHAKELNMPLPEEPILFIKPVTTLIGPEENIIYPSQSKQVDYEAELAIIIKDKIKEIHERLYGHFEQNKTQKKISFTDFVGKDRDERIISFSPLLHLENQRKVWLEQPEHFEEIHIWMNKTFFKHNPDYFDDLRNELEEEMKELDDEKKKRIQEINEDFENPIDDLFEE